MKRPKKIYHTHEKEVVNRESGEVISSETVKKTKYLARQFSKIYIDGISELVQLTYPELRIYLLLIKLIPQQTSFFKIDTGKKQHIVDQTGYSISHINNTLTSLNSKGMITRVSRGGYHMSPDYFFRGKEWENDVHTKMIDKIKGDG